MTKKIFRVEHPDTNTCLWYNSNGEFINNIKKDNQLSKFTCNQLPMDIDENIKGWFSGTETVQDLFKWFSPEEMLVLQSKGFMLKICVVEECYVKNYTVPNTTVTHTIFTNPLSIEYHDLSKIINVLVE